MSLAERLSEYVRACFTGLWIESHEHEDALAEMAGLCRQESWTLAVWDIDRGLQQAGQEAPDTGGSDPLAAIRALGSLAAANSTALLVLVNFHRFLNSAEIVQALARQITLGKQQRTFVVVLSPVVQIPMELEKLFIVVEHELPSRAQLEEIARGIATEAGELPDGNELKTVLDASAGLTRYEAEGAFSLSLVRHGRLAADRSGSSRPACSRRAACWRSTAASEDFQSLGGLASLKAFCKRSLLQPGGSQPHKRPRGVLLLGVPGSGKSAFAKALGKETGRPTIILDVGALMGSLVGQSEQNIRQALRIADAMAPAILFVDECEKALSGVASSGPDRLGRLGPAVRLAADLDERPYERRLPGGHLQRHLQAAAGVQPGRTV